MRSAGVRHYEQHGAASDHDIVALYVGRIAPEKNLELAVDAYRRCSESAERDDRPRRATRPSGRALQKRPNPDSSSAER